MSASDTTFLRDMSHYDSDVGLAGYAGTTHKITEGTGYVDPAYAARMGSFRADGRVLGSYHVLRTGKLAAQLDFWVSQQDRLTPWWRDWPHWIMQVDAEKWPNDQVSASTVLQFAHMLQAASLPGLKICYASRGQYGFSLTGISVDLWNAAYHSLSYPGNAADDWRPYSGKTPVFWQYTSTPYDKNAFRGSVADLLAYVSGGETDVNLTDKYGDDAYPARDVQDRLKDAAKLRDLFCEASTGIGFQTALKATPQNALVRQIMALPGQVAQIQKQVTELQQAPAVQITQEQINAAMLAALKSLAAGS